MIGVGFPTAARVSAGLCLSLAVLYLARPDIPLRAFGQFPDEMAGFGLQRAGALLGGFAAMFWHARKVHARRAQIAMASGLAIALILMAATSLSLWLRDLVDARMILIVGLELLWAAMMLSTTRRRPDAGASGGTRTA